MNSRPAARSAPPAASKWPNLQHKYGKLGIPAVVAAMMPEAGAPSRRAPETRERNATAPAAERR